MSYLSVFYCLVGLFHLSLFVSDARFLVVVSFCFVSCVFRVLRTCSYVLVCIWWASSSSVAMELSDFFIVLWRLLRRLHRARCL